MENLTKFEINGQEGFLLIDGKHIVGVYSHHNKIVIILAGKCDENKIELPDEMRDYGKLFRVADSVAVQCWTDSGWLGIHDIKQRWSQHIKH